MAAGARWYAKNKAGNYFVARYAFGSREPDNAVSGRRNIVVLFTARHY